MMLPIKISIRFFIFLSLAFSCCGIADTIPERPLNPYTYYSPNKQFSLKVIPSDRHGFGAADYLLMKNGVAVFHREFPFTVKKAAVSDNGDIAGYSYSTADKDDKSQMHFWLLSAQGKINLDKAYEQHRGGIDGPRIPLAQDVFIHPFNKTATFIIYDNGNNSKWVSYSLLTSKEISTVVVPFETYRDRIKKIVLSDFNPYSLVAISHRVGKDDDWHSNEEFCLLDKMWDKIDCKTYLDEFSKATPDANIKQYDTLINSDQYIGFTRDNKFWVTSFKKTAQDFFAIRYSLLDHKTTIEQLGSKSIKINFDVGSILKPVKQLVALAERPLPESILKGKESFTIVNMAFDELNRKATISRKDGSYYFERYDDNKKLLSVQLKNIENGISCQDLIYYKNGQWLLFLTRFNEQAKLLLLSSKGDLIREIKIDVSGALHIAKNKDNVVYVLANKSSQRASLMALNVETGDVTLRKTLKNYYDNGLVITNDKKIAVLGKVNGFIDFYSLSGEYLQSIELGKIADIKNSYVTEMQVDANGLLYVFDFSSHQLISIDDNKLHKKVSIVREDGKQLENIYFLKIDLKNNLWVTNEYGSVIHIDESGKEVENIQKPMAVQPKSINWLYVDREENIFVFDNSQYLLSKIDKRGVVKNIYQTPAKDQVSLTSIGRAIWKTQDGFIVKEKDKSVHIDENGKRINDFYFECDWPCTNIIPFVVSSSYWQEEYEQINFVSAKKLGSIVSISKDKDGNWLEPIHRVNQNENDWLSFSSEKKLIAIDNFGKIQATFPLDEYLTAWSQVSNNFVYVVSYKNDLIQVYNLSGTLVASTKTHNAKSNSSMPPVLYASGVNKKLYVLSENSIKVYQLLEK